MSDRETTPQGGIFGGQNMQDAERREQEREERNAEREQEQQDKASAAQKDTEKDYAEWQRQNPDNNITHDPMDADNRKQERDRWEARQQDQRDQERAAKEREEAEKQRKAEQEKAQSHGGSWLNRSVTADLAGVAKAVAGGKELTGQNSLTSSLAQLIEKGQAKAQAQLTQEQERDRENQR
jgi:hypothetical protein